MTHNDVTAGYIISDVERLRKPMQAITDNLLKFMKKSSDDLLSLMNTHGHLEYTELATYRIIISGHSILKFAFP